MNLFERITLRRDLPEHGLAHGAVGAIVDLYGDPVEACEVEFMDDAGRTLAIVTLRVADVEAEPPDSNAPPAPLP